MVNQNDLQRSNVPATKATTENIRNYTNDTLPSNTKITRISNIVPSTPDGPYPHSRLCGHVGNAPRSRSIKRTSKIVLSIYLSYAVMYCDYWSTTTVESSLIS